MGACHVHRVDEPGCVDCLQDARDCLREEVNQLRATLQIAGLEPAGEKCVRCSWMGNDVLKKCWPCSRIEHLEGIIYRVGKFFDTPEIKGNALVIPHKLAADVLTVVQKCEG